MGHHNFSGQLCQHLTVFWARNFFLTSNVNLLSFRWKLVPLSSKLRVWVPVALFWHSISSWRRARCGHCTSNGCTGLWLLALETLLPSVTLQQLWCSCKHLSRWRWHQQGIGFETGLLLPASSQGAAVWWLLHFEGKLHFFVCILDGFFSSTFPFGSAVLSLLSISTYGGGSISVLLQLVLCSPQNQTIITVGKDL